MARNHMIRVCLAGVVRPSVQAVLSLALLASCREAELTHVTFQSTDSAGVTIVESARPLWQDGEGWTLSPEPEVVIGQAEGDERYLLDRVAGARRFSDGRIAVLDVGSDRVRIYDSSGTHLMDLGGEGEGPSEFRQPQYLGVIADTLVVFEYFPASLTWFGPDGTFLRTNDVLRLPHGQLPRGMSFGYLENRFGVAIMIPSDRDRPHKEGVNRHEVAVWRFDLRGPGADSILLVPGVEEVIDLPEDGSIGHQPFLFGKTSYLTVSGEYIYSAPSDDFSVRQYGSDGVLERIVRKNLESRRVTSEDVDRYVDQRLRVFDVPTEDWGRYEEIFRGWEVSETMPAFRWVVADGEDNLWVEGWEDVGFGQGKFSIFRPDGAWLGDLDLPPGLPEGRGGFFQHWFEIGEDYLLGVWVDEYGVEQVRQYGIEKG